MIPAPPVSMLPKENVFKILSLFWEVSVYSLNHFTRFDNYSQWDGDEFKVRSLVRIISAVRSRPFMWWCCDHCGGKVSA